MRITLLHPPHTAIGSRVPREHLPPFGLLCIGGPLIDAGHQVRLVNADPGPMPLSQILHAALHDDPDAVLISPLWDEAQRALLRVVVQSTRRVTVDDPAFDAARQALGSDRALFELLAVTAAYNMVSRLLVAFGVEPEV